MNDQTKLEDFEDEVKKRSPFEGFPAKMMVLALSMFVLCVVCVLMGTVENLTELYDSTHKVIFFCVGVVSFVLMVYCVYKFIKELKPTHAHSKSLKNIISYKN